MPSLTDRQSRINDLRRGRQKHWFLRATGLILIGLTIWAWASAGKLTGRLPWERRWTNFQNFLGELTPSPVREADGNWLDAIPWAWELLTDKGFIALGNTIAIACVSIILSAFFVMPFLIFASRQLARRDPFGIFSGGTERGHSCPHSPTQNSEIPTPLDGKLTRQRSEDSRETAPQDSPKEQGPVDDSTGSSREANSNFGFRFSIFRFVGPTTRFLFVLARAVPEYIIAFLLISLLGVEVWWPLVLALAIHNFGILGRLFGEVVENADSRAAEQAIANGFGRKKVFGLVIFPAIFNRFLIYFFYRWETCVKDATVLGMLGVLTLGQLIILSKGFFWDEMMFYVLLAASIIMIGDLFSTWLRHRLRG